MAGNFVLFSSGILAPVTVTGWPVAGAKYVCCMEAGIGEPHKAEMSQTSLAVAQRQDVRGTRLRVEERLELRAITWGGGIWVLGCVNLRN